MESQIFLRIEFQTPESFSPPQGGETKAGGWLRLVDGGDDDDDDDDDDDEER